MVLDLLDVAIKMPIKTNVKMSRIVIISGLLTLMYCIEFAIGIRTVYYTFKLWTAPTILPQEKRLSWTMCVACLFTATLTSFAVNILSAVWEQKHLVDKGREKSLSRFIFHVIVGGMIWRYINLWCVASKQFQKKGALLLTMTKFFFTQIFTIPMVIVHVSVTEYLDELLYVVILIFCVTLTLILTCTMFAWCAKEVEELQKWDYETINLIPLLFQSDSTITADNNNTNSKSKMATDAHEKEAQKSGKPKKKESSCKFDLEETIIKFIVLFQSFGFSLGRLLALGILLKLAGMYAVSIMFLQLLISVIYLKFQAPIHVSDSLPKWRQLTRFAFMGYILIFEWHLNRDPKTAYDFSFNIKHNILYYCIATVESVFYLVTWVITVSYMSKAEPPEVRKEKNMFCRIILITGSLSLVFSLSIHILLLFWRSRKFSKFFYSVRRRYDTAKLNWSNGFRGEKNKTPDKNIKRPNISHIDISHPIPITKIDPAPDQDQGDQTSYRDLREPVDDEIEIYFRKCDNRRNSRENSPYRDIRQSGTPERRKEFSNEKMNIRTIDNILREEVNNSYNSSVSPSRRGRPATITPTNLSPVNTGRKHESKTAQNDKAPSEKSLKFKISSFSDNLNEHLGKMSRKISGTVKERFQHNKDHFANFKSHLSNSKTTGTQQGELPEDQVKTYGTVKPFPNPSPTPSSKFSKAPVKTPTKRDPDEGYFVGDDRYYQTQNLHPDQALYSKRMRLNEEIRQRACLRDTEDDVLPPSDIVHKDDDTPCPCYICKTYGEDKVRRRRSSSVPPHELKMDEDDEDIRKCSSMPRYQSSPNVTRNQTGPNVTRSPRGTKNLPSPRGTKNLSSPSGTRDLSSPSETRDLPSPRGTRNLSSPSGTRNLSSPSVTRNPSSPRGTRNESSSHATGNESNSHATGNESSPYATGNESSSYATSNQSSPYVTRNQSSPYAARNQSSPYSTRNQSSPYATRNPPGPYTTRNPPSPRVERNQSSPNMPRNQSSPNVMRNLGESETYDQKDRVRKKTPASSPRMAPRPPYNLSQPSPNKRLEHYV